MTEKEGRWEPAELAPVVAELLEKAEPPYSMRGAPSPPRAGTASTPERSAGAN
jgi:hypothetical protein